MSSNITTLLFGLLPFVKAYLMSNLSRVRRDGLIANRIPNRGRAALVTYAVALCTILAPGTGAAAWKARVLGKGFGGSVAVTPDGTTHLVYVKGRAGLVHLQFAPTGRLLAKETVNGPDGAYATAPAIAADSKGRIHLAYRDSVGAAGVPIIYGLLENGVWSFQSIDTGVNSLAIAVDSHDHPHLVYNDIHAWFDGSLWHKELVPGLAPLFTLSLAVGTDDSVHIAFDHREGGNDSVCHAVKTSDSWNVDQCFSGGLFPSIALDQENRPRLAFGGENNAGAHYVEFDGAQWTDTLLSAEGTSATVNIDAANDPRILLTTVERRRTLAVYLHRFEGTWFGRALGSAPSLSLGSLDLDPAGFPHGTLSASGAMSPFVQVYAFETGADLTPAGLTIANSSQGLQAQLTVANRGSAAGSGFKASFFVSDDATLSPDDTPLKTLNISAPAGKQRTFSFKFQPDGSVSGKFLIAQITSKHPEAEGNTTNNVASVQIP